MVESIASEKTNLSRYRTRISIHQACELFISRWNEEDKRETAVSAGAFFNRLHKRETHRKNGPEGWKPFPFPVFLISMPRVVVFRARDDTETMAGLGATRVPWILITFPSLDSSETRPPSKSCSSRPNVIYVIIFRDNGTRVIRIRYLFSLTPCQRMTYWSSVTLVSPVIFLNDVLIRRKFAGYFRITATGNGNRSILMI